MTSDSSVLALQQASVLRDNLTKRFAAGAADGALDNFRAEVAAALALQGKGSLIDVASVLDKAAAVQDTSWGTLAKYLWMASFATMTSEQQAQFDTQFQRLCTDIEQSDSILSYSAVWALPVVAAQSPTDTALISKLVNSIRAGQSSSGLVGGYGYDYETTAQAAYALAVASKNIDINAISGYDETMKSAFMALIAARNANGGFSYTIGGKSDVDTTGWALTALLYVKAVRPDASFPSKSLTAALQYLVSAADSDLAGYKTVTASNEYLTCGSAFLGVCAYLSFNGTALDEAMHTIVDANLTLGKSSFVYDGKSHVPAAVVRIGGTTLQAASDYEKAGASKAVKAGTYEVSVAGIGSYGGSATASYSIVPAKVTGVKATAGKSCKVTTSWSNKLGKAAGVDGYKVDVKYGSQAVATKTVKKAATSKATLKLATKYAGKKVKVTVTAYKGELQGVASKAVTVKVSK